MKFRLGIKDILCNPVVNVLKASQTKISKTVGALLAYSK